MSDEPSKDATEAIRDQVEAVIAQGDDVRQGVSRIVSQAAEAFQNTSAGLLGLAQSVMEGAKTSVDRAVPNNPDSVLRQVVDGLGDGLSATALASKMALEEANAQRKAFANEDLAKIRDDLRTLADLFTKTVTDATDRIKSVSGSELDSLRSHAQQTFERVRPSLESAVSAAAKQPIQLGKESLETSVALSQHALGALFSSVGKFLQDAGQRLAPTPPPAPAPPENPDNPT